VLLAFDKVKLPLEKQLSDIGVVSLGIYLVNTPAIYVTSTLIYKFAPWLLGQQILYQPIVTAAGLFVPLLLLRLFRQPLLKRYSLLRFWLNFSSRSGFLDGRFSLFRG
jgi:hypothetical protein